MSRQSLDPADIVAELREHMAAYTATPQRSSSPACWVGAAPGNFRRDSGWTATVGKLGVPGLHFHDLRHTGNTLAAPGASLADLKARMGHDSARAAMIYQHATAAADRAIADALDRQIEASGQG
jgi:lambda repressor-like predicted transcriptional regulator